MVRYRLTDLETVREEGAWPFRVRDQHGNDEAFFLVPCENPDGPPVRAWYNSCTHEAQRLYRDEIGAVIRDGGIVCPKHGSIFDACSGECANGEAAGTTLPSVEIAVENDQVYLADDDVRFLAAGTAPDDDDDDGPSSTSHLQL